MLVILHPVKMQRTAYTKAETRRSGELIGVVSRQDGPSQLIFFFGTVCHPTRNPKSSLRTDSPANRRCRKAIADENRRLHSLSDLPQTAIQCVIEGFRNSKPISADSSRFSIDK